MTLNKIHTSTLDVGQYVIYPSHGVGQIIGFESQTISDHTIDLIVISFHYNKMMLRIPFQKAQDSGLRPLSSPEHLKTGLDMLKITPPKRKISWLKKSQEYDQKLNSGDLISIVEVVREIHKNGDASRMSFRERQIYQTALSRLSQELAAVQEITIPQATDMVEQLLKST